MEIRGRAATQSHCRLSGHVRSEEQTFFRSRDAIVSKVIETVQTKHFDPHFEKERWKSAVEQQRSRIVDSADTSDRKSRRSSDLEMKLSQRSLRPYRRSILILTLRKNDGNPRSSSNAVALSTQRTRQIGRADVLPISR